MTSRGFRIAALTCAVLLLAPQHAGATWAPQSDEWASFRQNLSHTATIAGTSAFTAGQGGFARVKWEKELNYPVLGAPSVADLDRDGVPEVVASSTDIHAQVATLDISFNHRISSMDGADGDFEWEKEEGNSFSLAQGPSILSHDGDAQAEVVYFAGNPITGTPATNKLVSLSHTGAEQWRFSDGALDGWNNAQHPVGIIVFPQTANVDAEAAQNEVVFSMTQADFLVTAGDAGPDCPDPNADKIIIEGSNISYFVHALNGEGASPANSWKHKENSALDGSTPVIADLNGDGRNDVVWGSGSPSGPVLPSCEVEVRLDSSAEDNKVLAVNGANPPNFLWSKTFQDPAGVDRPMSASPVLAGTTAGGDPILVFLIPVPDFEPVANDPDRNILWALNGRTGDTLWKTTVRPATIVPLAATDIDGDAQPELIVQVAGRLAAFDNRTGALQWEATYARTLTSAGVAIADLDSDGTKEIVAVLEGSRNPAEPKAEVLVVDATNGAVEWSMPLLQDQMIGGPVIADVDGDDDLLEIVTAGGSPTVDDNVDHKGRVFVLEPNAPDLQVTNVEVIGSRIRNEPQTVRATVRNAGTRDTSAAFRLTDDGATVGEQTVSLAAGATSAIDYPWTPATFGNHVLRVVSDPSGAVRELAENNNDRSLTVRILALPEAGFTFSPSAPNETQTVQLTDQSTDADGTIASRSWSCTDGFASTAQNPKHKFADGAAYQCTLTVTDNDGLTDSETKTIDVSHVAPMANFTHTVINPGQLQFTDTSTHPNVPDAPPSGWTYSWDFTNDGTTDSSERSPFHDYGVQTGVFDVRLQVMDNDGLSHEVVKQVDVAIVNQAPTANFKTQPAIPVGGSDTSFIDQSSDPDGQIVRIDADWGDGTAPGSVSGANVAGSTIKHRYAQGGDYTVTWKVTDNRGATDTEQRVVHVCQPPGTTGPGIRVEVCTSVQV